MRIDLLNMLYHLLIWNFGDLTLDASQGGFGWFIARAGFFEPVVILVAGQTKDGKNPISGQTQSDVPTSYLFFLAQAYFFFISSSLSRPSNSFSASSFFNKSFSFSSRLISFR